MKAPVFHVKTRIGWSEKVGPNTGASKISILLWARSGDKTWNQAITSGRSLSRGWQQAQEAGYIFVDPTTGVITATACGLDYLAEETFYS